MSDPAQNKPTQADAIAAENTLLRDALVHAQRLVQFLHGCLTEPDTHAYRYPNQTAERLAEWAALAPAPETCHHSGTVVGCPGCRSWNLRRAQTAAAKKVLAARQPPTTTNQETTDAADATDQP